jgi:hypothetical protein
MSEEIGAMAGAIRHKLETKGEMTLAKLKNAPLKSQDLQNIATA